MQIEHIPNPSDLAMAGLTTLTWVAGVAGLLVLGAILILGMRSKPHPRRRMPRSSTQT